MQHISWQSQTLLAKEENWNPHCNNAGSQHLDYGKNCSHYQHFVTSLWDKLCVAATKNFHCALVFEGRICYLKASQSSPARGRADGAAARRWQPLCTQAGQALRRAGVGCAVPKSLTIQLHPRSQLSHRTGSTANSSSNSEWSQVVNRTL